MWLALAVCCWGEGFGVPSTLVILSGGASNALSSALETGVEGSRVCCWLLALFPSPVTCSLRSHPERRSVQRAFFSVGDRSRRILCLLLTARPVPVPCNLSPT